MSIIPVDSDAFGDVLARFPSILMLQNVVYRVAG
jgi:hypothetical protein